MIRLLSQTEASTLLDCSWRWDLAYGGRLTGSALVPKDTPLLLREGRAWGKAMAVYHTRWNRTDQMVSALLALHESIREDSDQQAAHGLYDPEAEAQTLDLLNRCLEHYHRLDEPLPLTGAETHLVQPLPANQRHSNRYQLEAFLDGLHEDEHGVWVVEFKWRASRLADFELAARSRQLRWYSWCWREHLGIEPVGVILDERLGKAPEPVRLNLDGQPSKVQDCTAEAYEQAGGRSPDVIARLDAKQWQARRRITFRPGELDQAGRELRSMARLIQLHDSGQVAPIRNPSQARCPRCRFRAICDQPEDAELVSALYDRVPPKREREEVADAA